ncbi:MAG: hypothetical protein ACE5G8_05115 [Anaerolineae bacterium]
MSFKLLLSYNIKEHRLETYYRFIMGEFLPRAQALGLAMTEGWHTAYGDYPARLLIFRPDDNASVAQILQSDEWDAIETRLGEFVSDYEKCLVRPRRTFQFFIPHYRRQSHW